jgi:predicted  nucleic acid-binding Zn-ribbon protein
VSVVGRMVRIGDIDLLLRELAEPAGRARLAKLGLGVEGVRHVAAARARIAAEVERRWLMPYERARQRYGRGLAAVRERVCQGCFVTLPTSAAPRPDGGDAPGLCQSCGRLLYWG